MSRRTATKVLASLSIVGSAAAVAGLGTFGSFTSTTEAEQDVRSGTVVIALGDAQSDANQLDVGATGLVPGDTLRRTFDLSNTGSEDFAGVALTTTALPEATSVLDTDAQNGLQLVIERCAVAWTGSGCDEPSSVVASRRVIGSAIDMSGLSLVHGTTNHLRLTLTLPTSADNGFQGKQSTVHYVFTGIQREATSK